MANLKTGDKCIIIGGAVDEDLGKIVVVSGYMNSCWFNGEIWEAEYDVIITSEGSPLTKVYSAAFGGQLLFEQKSTVMTKPFCSRYLRKLPEIADPVEERELEVVRP